MFLRCWAKLFQTNETITFLVSVPKSTFALIHVGHFLCFLVMFFKTPAITFIYLFIHFFVVILLFLFLVWGGEHFFSS